jgi:AcrR family transcriptional regulator
MHQAADPPAAARRPRRTQAERTARSDARLLDTAVALVCERGSHGTTLKEVGERAGYSRGLAGYRFGSKTGLLVFLVRAVGEEWLRELKTVTAGRHGLDAIGAALDAHQRLVVEAAERVRAFYLLWFESIGPGSELHDVIERVHRRRRADVIGWIEAGIAAGRIDPGVDAGACADHFCAAINGIVYQWLIRPESVAEVAALHATLKLAMQRLLPPPASI